MQDDVTKKFKKYKIVSEKKFKEYCFPKNFELQKPQKFIADILQNYNINKLLLFHSIGGGKTCTSIRVAETFKNKLKIYVVTPASLISNYYKELLGECTNNSYLSNKERENLKKMFMNDKNEYEKIKNDIFEKIKQTYNILSYQKFIKTKIKKDVLLIIDEVHNIISEKGSFYNSFKKKIFDLSKKGKILFMTATPIYDKPEEIALLLNLFDKNNKFPTGKNFRKYFYKDKIIKKIDKKIKKKIILNDDEKNMLIKKYGNVIKNSKKFYEMIENKISYFKGAPKYTYPEKEYVLVKCQMNDKQNKIYKKYSDFIKSKEYENENKNFFFIKSRAYSNIIMDKNKINENVYNN